MEKAWTDTTKSGMFFVLGREQAGENKHHLFVCVFTVGCSLCIKEHKVDWPNEDYLLIWI